MSALELSSGTYMLVRYGDDDLMARASGSGLGGTRITLGSDTRYGLRAVGCCESGPRWHSRQGVGKDLPFGLESASVQGSLTEPHREVGSRTGRYCLRRPTQLPIVSFVSAIAPGDSEGNGCWTSHHWGPAGLLNFGGMAFVSGKLLTVSFIEADNIVDTDPAGARAFDGARVPGCASLCGRTVLEDNRSSHEYKVLSRALDVACLHDQLKVKNRP
eukprot:6072604-Amphidinium_carterae.1